MVGGAAYYAGRKVAQGETREAQQQAQIDQLAAQQYQSQQYAPPPPQYAPPPQPAAPAAPQKSAAEQLTELKQLLDAGALTQQEFDTAKAKVLGS
jgi:hypothetical protein